MKTYLAKKETVEPKWYVIDAENVVVGRLCTRVASVLRGKHKPIYTPHLDTGDHVIVVNASKVVLTSGKEAKKVATSFDNGRGVPFLSPWQVSRAARDDAERIGSYTSRALSETAEATNSADMIVSLLAPLDNSDRIAMLTMQVLKNRDGETAQSIMVEVDYANAYFRSRTGTLMGDSGSSILGL